MSDPASPTLAYEDGPLGAWTSAFWSPPALAGAVSVLWSFEGTLAHARERLFPDGSVELIVHLGARYRSVTDDGHRAGFPTLCFSGLRLTREVIEAPGGPVSAVGIRLTPMGAAALLRGVQTEAVDRTLDLADAVGAAARSLADGLADARGPDARLRAAARWVARCLRDASPPDPAVVRACAALETTRGRASIADVCEHVGVSGNRLPGRFKAALGVTPKQYARVLRFRHALARLNEPTPPSLAEVAFDAGYADQPHFNAEFRSLAGLSPGAYLHAARYPNSLSLAEVG